MARQASSRRLEHRGIACGQGRSQGGDRSSAGGVVPGDDVTGDAIGLGGGGVHGKAILIRDGLPVEFIGRAGV